MTGDVDRLAGVIELAWEIVDPLPIGAVVELAELIAATDCTVERARIVIRGTADDEPHAAALAALIERAAAMNGITLAAVAVDPPRG